MAKKDSKENKETSFIDRLRTKVRIVVVNMETYEEKRHFILSALNIVVFVSFVTILLVIATYLIIAYTPIKKTIPGFPGSEEELALKQIDQQNLNFIDDIKNQGEINSLYYQNLEAVLNDQVPIDPTVGDSNADVDSLVIDDLSFEASKEDSILRGKIDEREKYAVLSASGIIARDDDLKGVFLFPPLKGTVSDPINTSEGHFGVDIIAPKDEAVKATLGGTIVFTDWTPENGHIIHVQHGHNLLSIYKHNSFILKKTGDVVEAGEPIAIIGNSGELSSGPHLHFELWHNGTPLNPEDFITF